MKFDGLRKPPAFRLMLRILLFFGDTVGDGVLHEAQHAVEMSCEHARDLLRRVPGGIVRPSRTTVRRKRVTAARCR